MRQRTLRGIGKIVICHIMGGLLLCCGNAFAELSDEMDESYLFADNLTDGTENRNVAVSTSSVSYDLNYTNYWVKEDDTLLLHMKNCSGSSGYAWTVDDALISNQQDFTLDASLYEIGTHRVDGYCYGHSFYNNETFNIEIISNTDFALIVLPDTQYYSQDAPQIFDKQTLWITEMKDSLNIKFATHLGDVVDDGSFYMYQWDNADNSMSILDSIIPYALSMGNHDYDDKSITRNTVYWNNYFNISRYDSEPWWGGNQFDNNENTYQYFDSNGFEFMIIHLAFCPTNETLDWANQIVANNPDKRVIITTHSYLAGSERIPSYINSKNTCGAFGSDGNNGEDIWQKFVKKHKNIFLVLSGHTSVGYLKSLGDNENIVHQVGSCYHSLAGNRYAGYLRIMRFSPLQNKIFVQTYSPYLDVLNDSSYLDESDSPVVNEFSITYSLSIINSCKADINEDGGVNIFDCIIMKNDYAKDNCNINQIDDSCQADINIDGEVNAYDLLLLRKEYNNKDCIITN